MALWSSGGSGGWIASLAGARYVIGAWEKGKKGQGDDQIRRWALIGDAAVRLSRVVGRARSECAANDGGCGRFALNCTPFEKRAPEKGPGKGREGPHLITSCQNGSRSWAVVVDGDGARCELMPTTELHFSRLPWRR